MLTLYAKLFDNFNDIFHSFRQNVARQFMHLTGIQLQRNASKIKFDRFVQKKFFFDLKKSFLRSKLLGEVKYFLEHGRDNYKVYSDCYVDSNYLSDRGKN